MLTLSQKCHLELQIKIAEGHQLSENPQNCNLGIVYTGETAVISQID